MCVERSIAMSHKMTNKMFLRQLKNVWQVIRECRIYIYKHHSDFSYQEQTYSNNFARKCLQMMKNINEQLPLHLVQSIPANKCSISLFVISKDKSSLKIKKEISFLSLSSFDREYLVQFMKIKFHY